MSAIGPVVHYRMGDGRCVSAIVTDERERGGGEYELKLTLFPPGETPVPLAQWVPMALIFEGPGWHEARRCRR